MLEMDVCFADIDECVSAPCQNGGTCVDQVNGYLCQCAPGYTDLQCQTGKDMIKTSFETMQPFAFAADGGSMIITLNVSLSYVHLDRIFSHSVMKLCGFQAF